MGDSKNQIRNAVRECYSEVVENSQITSGCGCGTDNGAACCDAEGNITVEEASVRAGYSIDEIRAVPNGTNLGLACGNPHAIAAVKAGETVLDLGCGAGNDVFLAACKTGEKGKAIGVDMTPQMVYRARQAAQDNNYTNVDFRLGEIEHLPVESDSIDVIISNCVINLSPEKQEVFNEAFRVLRSGGRLAVSDIVTSAELPEHIRSDMKLYTACVAGASRIDDLKDMLTEAGFVSISITPLDTGKNYSTEWTDESNISDCVFAANIVARKP